MAVDTKWFKDRLREIGRSQRAAARHLEMDPSSFSLALRGERRLKMQEAIKLSQFLSAPVQEVLKRAGMPEAAIVTTVTTTADVPLVGFVDGHGEVHIEEPTEEFGRVAGPPGLKGEVVAVQFRTALSTRELFDGWTLFFRPSETVAADIIGSLAVVRLENGGPTVLRFVRRGYKPGSLNLHSMFDPPLENVKPVWATPVLWVRAPV